MSNQTAKLPISLSGFNNSATQTNASLFNYTIDGYNRQLLFTTYCSLINAIYRLYVCRQSLGMPMGTSYTVYRSAYMITASGQRGESIVGYTARPRKTRNAHESTIFLDLHSITWLVHAHRSSPLDTSLG